MAANAPLMNVWLMSMAVPPGSPISRLTTPIKCKGDPKWGVKEVGPWPAQEAFVVLMKLSGAYTYAEYALQPEGWEP